MTKQPKKRSATRKAKIKFTSTVAGSTFTCALDGKAAKPCTSPYKKRVKIGKHTVVITATSPFGIVDPTPATVKFKVTEAEAVIPTWRGCLSRTPRCGRGARRRSAPPPGRTPSTGPTTPRTRSPGAWPARTGRSSTCSTSAPAPAR